MSGTSALSTFRSLTWFRLISFDCFPLLHKLSHTESCFVDNVTLLRVVEQGFEIREQGWNAFRQTFNDIHIHTLAEEFALSSLENSTSYCP